MKILVVSDDPAPVYYDYYRPGKLDEFDLIISCGDLSRNYLEFLVTMAHCPLLYVRGNHDDALIDKPPEGCECLEDTIITVNGLRILGLGGSYRYKKTGRSMYNERQMEKRIHKLRWKLRRAGGVDIIVAHAPIRGFNDFDTLSHRGFECFQELIEKYRPRYFIHGHIHRSYGVNIPQVSRYRTTTVINGCDHFILDTDEELKES